MSSAPACAGPERRRLIAALFQASRENSTAAVFFHAAIAARFGLGPTDEKTLELLGRVGPLTAGELAARTGLTTAAVTSLIDRLERKGFVRRVRDRGDRRRVIVEPDEAQLAEFGNLFDPVRESFADLLELYSDEQLATIADFLTRAARRSLQAIERLPAGATAAEDGRAAAPGASDAAAGR